MSNDIERLSMFNRDLKTSLYNCGYADGYDNKSYNPRWIPEGLCESDAVYVIDKSDIEEYDQGYSQGSLHFLIDRKTNN